MTVQHFQLPYPTSILDDTSKTIRMKIPMKFVMKHGEHLSSPVHLKLPSGVEWEIEFRRCNNDGVWFKTRVPQSSPSFAHLAKLIG
ncbi:hypothetical protein ACE6H2_027391 [Prunus campanulata]